MNVVFLGVALFNPCETIAPKNKNFPANLKIAFFSVEQLTVWHCGFWAGKFQLSKEKPNPEVFFPFCCTFKWQCVEEREARIKRAWMHATHSQPESSRGESVTGRREVAKWVSSCFWFFGVFVLLLLREEVKTRLLQIPGRKPTAAWKFSPSLGIATTNENSKLSAALQFWGTETTLNSILLEIIVE